MSLVDPTSLAVTLDLVNDALFHARPLTDSQRREVAGWVAERQGLPGSYAGMPAPTDRDYAEGCRAFTGEKIRAGGGMGHILGEEACRALILLDVPDAAVQSALAESTRGMMERLLLENGKPNPRLWGTYCCCTCSVAYWRHLAAGGLQDQESRLAAGLEFLHSRRDGNGRWKAVPFYYTLLALSEEPNVPRAVDEMRYAAPSLERMLARPTKADVYDGRRRVLAERVLSLC